MQLLDWIIIAICLTTVFGVGIFTQRYMKSVADFLSAGRVARRYLLAIGRSEMGAGAVIYVSVFETISETGFGNGWWGSIATPVVLLVAIFGFVAYRYRETRAMTLGQFFEIRYSKKFRLFMGLLGFISGVLNFGIMPLVGARMMVYFLSLPPELHLNGMIIQTYIPLMGLFLLINLLIGTSGGILTVMMTNFAEGFVSQILYVFLIIGLIWMFSWSQIHNTLVDQPPGHSLIHPMDGGKLDFNFWYVIMSTCLIIYGTMGWQNQSAYNSAPLTAHEARMSNLLGRWKSLGSNMMMVLLAICGLTYLHDAQFAAGAAQVHDAVNKIADPHTRSQMEVAIAVVHLLPVGLKGALCAAMLLGIFGGDSSHLHSWSSILVQDVILPLRKKALSPVEHIRYLRLSMVGVVLFAFLFGVFCSPNFYIQVWWMITGSIFMGGAGVSIIGGLYWKKGTTSGAWAGSIVGSVLAVSGITAIQIYGKQFFLTGPEVSFSAMVSAVTVYIIVSLLTRKEDFNLDRMLHRGAYAHIQEEVGDAPAPVKKRRLSWGKLVGYDENFTLLDKWVAGGLMGWTLAFSAISIFGTLWYLRWPWPLWVWSEYWHITAIILPAIIAVGTTIWFCIGGISDVIDLFRRLNVAKVNPLDNGLVIDHQNLDESILPDAVSPLDPEADKKPAAKA